jgi:type IV pilus assembly protein PilM
MFRLFESATFPIGIDAGAHSIRFLQFRKGASGGDAEGRPLSLQAACRVELDSLAGPPEGRFRAAVEQALASQDFSSKRAVLSLPASAVHAKSVRLPQMPDSDLGQALQWEAKDRFGFDVGDNCGQLVWFRSGEVRRGTEVKDELLLFAINGEVLNSYIEVITAAGLQLAAIDLSMCAAFRSLERVNAGISSGTAALLDMGRQSSQFIITRDGELVFYKNIDIGGRTVDEAIAAKLGIPAAEACQMRTRIAVDSDAASEAATLHQALRDAMRTPLEELAREVDMCMRYYVVTFRGSRPESIGLTGRQAAIADVSGLLSSALAVQIEEIPALRGVQELGDVARPDRSGEWAIASGLSLYPLNAARRAPRQRAEAAA